VSTPGERPAITPGNRLAELSARLHRVRARIETGCAAAGRPAAGVRLVVVTKTHPASDVAALADLGVRDVGENRDQEAAAKYEACRRAGVRGLRWHFVGRLQTNKARSVSRYADAVHSLDSARLAAALGAGARAAGRRVDCLLQVSLDGDLRRGGCLPDALESLAEAVLAEDGLGLAGVMAVAPLGVDPYRAFAVLPSLRERLLRLDPAAGAISAGMSGDLEAALACGATHLRVGSAVLGPRPSLG
jgi:pyridoxal phosphate enzyme (YggS family)